MLSYIGSACWLYEAKRARRGGALVWWQLARWRRRLVGVSEPGLLPLASRWSRPGLVLGLTMAAMLLGHWYLNSPGMELAPLRRLLVLMAVAVVAQIVVCAVGLVGHLQGVEHASYSWWLFVLLRWSFGLVGVLGLIWMAWETLKIPNTQSATGILYVAVIGVFVGELTGLLLSAESAFPL